jgi:hypothetical protein
VFVWAAFPASGREAAGKPMKQHVQLLNRCGMKRRVMVLKVKRKLLLTAVGAVTAVSAFSQDGAAGIEEANSQVRSYFEPGTNLMYAIGAVLGLVGAVKVFQKWNAGDQDTGKVAAAWFGSCIFLVVVATVLQSFFGL